MSLQIIKVSHLTHIFWGESLVSLETRYRNVRVCPSVFDSSSDTNMIATLKRSCYV